MESIQEQDSQKNYFTSSNQMSNDCKNDQVRSRVINEIDVLNDNYSFNEDRGLYFNNSFNYSKNKNQDIIDNNCFETSENKKFFNSLESKNFNYSNHSKFPNNSIFINNSNSFYSSINANEDKYNLFNKANHKQLEQVLEKDENDASKNNTRDRFNKTNSNKDSKKAFLF